MIKYLIAFLILAASVSAEDRPILRIDTVDCCSDIHSGSMVYRDSRCGGGSWAYVGCELIDTIFVDTAREYMTVDTVIDGARYKPVTDCMGKTSFWPTCDTTFDTTWLPKVQVWLMPEEMEALQCMINTWRSRNGLKLFKR